MEVAKYLLGSAYHPDDGSGDFVEVGVRYLDRFEKRSGEWRIAERAQALNFVRPVTPGENSALFKSPVMSRRDKGDPLWELRAAAGLD
jgi:hypothetical protein